MAKPAVHRIINPFYRIFVRCSDIMLHLTEFLLFFVMVIITYEVVARYIFRSPTLWVVDVSRYSLVYITFLGATSLLLRGEHINVDLVLAHLNDRSRLIFDIIGHAISALSFLALFLFSAATTWEHYARGTLVIDPIEIPKAIPLAIIPIGSFFLFIGCIARISEFWSKLKTPSKSLSRKETAQ